MRCALAAVLLMVVATAPIPAAGGDDADVCRNGEGDARIAACTRIVESSATPQERALAFDNRAEERRRQSLWADAAADYGRAIELEPTVKRYSDRGHSYYLSGQYARALKDFDKVAASTPNDAFNARYRAKTLWKLGETDRAFAEFGKAISLAPDDADLHVARADAYLEQKNYAMALPDLDKAIALEPDLTSAYLKRAEAHHRLGDKEKAIADVTRVTEIAPKDTVGYLNRALMYEDLGDYQAALADYDKLIALKTPDDGWYRERRAALIEKGAMAPTATAAVPPPPVEQSDTEEAAPAAPESAAEGDARAAAEREIDCKRFVPAVNLIVSVPCHD